MQDDIYWIVYEEIFSLFLYMVKFYIDLRFLYSMYSVIHVPYLTIC